MARNQDNVKYRARLYSIIIEAKSVPCADCGVRYPPYVMDFDHRNPAEKLGNIGCGRKWGEPRLRAEIAKCDVVCANCHRERTHGKSLTPPNF